MVTGVDEMEGRGMRSQDSSRLIKKEESMRTQPLGGWGDGEGAPRCRNMKINFRSFQWTVGSTFCPRTAMIFSKKSFFTRFLDTSLLETLTTLTLINLFNEGLSLVGQAELGGTYEARDGLGIKLRSLIPPALRLPQKRG